MTNEIKGRDLVRTLILSALGLGLLSLYFYIRGGFSFPIFEGLLALVAAAAIFDICWLNAKRSRLRSTPEKLISFPETQEKKVKRGRKITLMVGAVVVVGLTIQFLYRFWSLLDR